MASESKRQNAGNKVAVALPRSEPDSAASKFVSHEAALGAAIGARIRITTAAPNSGTVEGTIFAADSKDNMIVINTSTSPSSHSTSSTTVPSGSYRFISTSSIMSFQLLSLATENISSPTTSTSTALNLDPNTLDSASLSSRLSSTLSKLAAAESRRGPKGTTPQAQEIFDALSRSHPMRWVPSSSSNNTASSAGAAMLFSDEYVIDKPYQPENCKMLEGKGSAQGLERLKKVLRMERDKLELKWSAKEMDGKLGSGGGLGNKENVGSRSGVPASGPPPRKGG